MKSFLIKTMIPLDKGGVRRIYYFIMIFFSNTKTAQNIMPTMMQMCMCTCTRKGYIHL